MPLAPCVAALLLVSCGDAPPEWIGESPLRWHQLNVSGTEAAGFTALGARQTGVDFTNDPSAEMVTRNQHLANGGGASLGDVDGDGRVDIFLVNTRGANGLFLNRGGMRFEDASDAAGVNFGDRRPSGSALVDVDGDGDLDLLVSSMGAPVTLLENDGLGVFTDRSLESGFETSRAGSTMTLADIDGDGDLDLYAANYRLDRAADVFSSADRRETPVLERRDGEWVVNEMYREYYRVIEDAEGVLSWEFGQADDLYLNDGTGAFQREPISGSRFLDAEGEPLAVEAQEWGLAARFRDLNGDGAPDLYVANDFESPDQLWINDGAGTFRLTGAGALRKTSHASMSIAFADVDANGTTDIFVADMLPLSSRLRKTQVSTLMEVRPPPGSVEVTMQVNRNTLLLGNDDGAWMEAAQQAGLDASGWSWGAEFVDVDLDGHQDLLIATGHPWNAMDADTGERLRRTQAGAEWKDVMNLFPALRLPNRAFRNLGDGTFELVEGAWGLDRGEDISHGLATADLDGDGDLDVVVNRLGDPALVLRNDSEAARLAVKLVGLAPNTGAVGAKILVSGGPVDQVREVGAGGLYLSHSDGLQSFATGSASSLTIEVTWRSGARTVVEAEPNRLYEITEVLNQGAGPAPTGSPQATEGPLFEDLRAALAHTHADRPFNVTVAQPLIPRELSRLGPGITWTDSDGDGDPDLVVGAGAGGAVAYFENQNGTLRRAVAGPALEYDVTTLLPEPDGRSLLAGVANYEAPSPTAALEVPTAVSIRLGPGGPGMGVPALSSDGSSTGALASADVDGDGDLDVFVGGRVYASAYPLPPTSRLFRRQQDGSLVYDSAASAPFSRVGLVSGVTFTDIDGDADPDLVVATDWGPPRLFINNRGGFTESTRSWGLSPYLSWWNGVTAGDLDGDGRMDLVLTSWGRNIGLEARTERPLLGYWGDFDRNGQLDFLLAARDDRIGSVAPLTSFGRLSSGLPYVRRQTTTTYGAYADASLAQVLGPAISSGQVSEITTLQHMIFLNRGGRFEPRVLPAATQLAPAFHPSVADFDGDGHEDLMLTQNFFPNTLGAERFDAGRGLLLLGDGSGEFVPQTPSQSGISLRGDQRGAALADYDGDGRIDLAIGQNNGQTVLLHNRRGRRGIRVHLRGGAANPHGIGATVRVVYADRLGPARELRLGSGYWSVDDPVAVLGLRAEPEGIEVRWPDGVVQRVDVTNDQLGITVVRANR